MNETNLNEGQWEDRKQWSLGVGQRRKTFWNRYISIWGYKEQESNLILPEHDDDESEMGESLADWRDELYRVILLLDAPNTLRKIFQNLEKRIQMCLDVKGDQFQHWLWAGPVFHRSRYVYINFHVIIFIT
jgi:hypothetical protein